MIASAADNVAGLAIAVVLAAYLVIALVRPERF
ncbi:MAG: K(+)-transporting ATPase subunit F [Ilumatobacteraceae bacterium]|nr:K(+)-transporting ATPase subunit F [Ilumatobacter sp.]MCB0983540.1 K(+)-transporting ATPase subunit F [Ilumatobacter sp.]